MNITEKISRIQAEINAETGELQPALPGDWELKSANGNVAVRLHYRWVDKGNGTVCTITFAPNNILDLPLYAVMLPGGWVEYYLSPQGENIHPLKVGA